MHKVWLLLLILKESQSHLAQRKVHPLNNLPLDWQAIAKTCCHSEGGDLEELAKGSKNGDEWSVGDIAWALMFTFVPPFCLHPLWCFLQQCLQFHYILLVLLAAIFWQVGLSSIGRTYFYVACLVLFTLPLAGVLTFLEAVWNFLVSWRVVSFTLSSQTKRANKSCWS